MTAASMADASRQPDVATGLRPARGALTFFVLLLLVGAATTGGALHGMYSAAPQELMAPAAVRLQRVERPAVATAMVDDGCRWLAQHMVPVRTVADTLLPPIRGPDPRDLV
jgi:hypothetical protein